VTYLTHRLIKTAALTCAAAIAACVSVPLTASAEPSGTILTIGGFGGYAPEYEGAKDYQATFRPSFSWHKAGDRVWLSLPNDGASIALFQGDTYRAGITGNLRFQRHAEDFRPLGFKTVGDKEVSIEAGGFAEYWPMPFLRTRAELRYAFVGAEGLIGDLSADLVVRPMDRWTLTAGPRVSFADSTFMDSYYSVNAAASAVSGLAAFKAEVGLRGYGAGASAHYQLTENITTIGYIEYEKLSGDASNSPLVAQRGSEDQVTVGLGLKYSFAAPW